MRAALLLACLLAAPPAVAQVVAGVVTDAAGRPLADASVVLVRGGAVVAGAAADADGRYLLRGVAPGAYTLRVTRVGYAEAAAPLALEAGQRAVVDVELDEATADLGGVEVGAGREVDRLDRAGFYERRGRGQGRFFDRATIEVRRPRVLTDLFMNLPGFVPIVQQGDVRIASMNSIQRHENCRPTIVVDDVVLRSFGDTVMDPSLDGGLPTIPTFNLDAALRVDDVEAVEAYAHGGVPAQYGGTMSPCGAILIWTRAYGEAADPGDSETRPPRR